MGLIHQHRLKNGLWFVAEPIEAARSVAMSLLLRAGVAGEPNGQQGAATMLAEMICRGAGDCDARAHSEALDHLGVLRDSGAQTVHLRIGATMIGQLLADALPLIVDMVRRPQLDQSALEPSRALAIQGLEALQDEPQQKVMLELRSRHFPKPFDRWPLGRREDLQEMTLQQIHSYFQQGFVPDGAVLGVAGCFDWPSLRDQVQELLGDWEGSVPEPTATASPLRGYEHQQAKSTQVHIGLAYDALPENDPASMVQRAAVAVLAGGMSGRLFTEVREKRGLCYAVGARYMADKHRGAVLSYAGTTTPRAQETLSVLKAELHRLAEGVEPGEFDRAIVGMKSRLVMQGESTGARAAAIAGDQYIFGRPRSLDELAKQIDAITLDHLNQFVADHPPPEMTIVTIGPSELIVE